MSRKRPKPEEIVAKLRQADVLIGQGSSVAEAIRAIGVSEVTYYLYGRLSASILRPKRMLRRTACKAALERRPPAKG